MKPCTNCGNMIADNATYCYSCNTAQKPQYTGFEEFEYKPQYSGTFLKVLCILTIIGAVFSLFSMIITLTLKMTLPVENLKLLTYLGTGIAIGKLTGAIFMLKKKLTGLYIYTAAALLALGMQVYSVFVTPAYTEEVVAGSSIFVYITAAVSFVFLVAFLIMYWLPLNRRLLS